MAGASAIIRARPVRTAWLDDRRTLTILAVLVFVIGVGARVWLVDRHGVWADEAFSLAMATGHSLEHPAALADPALGDYVEPSAPVTPAELRRYLEHEQSGIAPGRVVRAVLLSDTNPPLYYVLLHGWTWLAGTSDGSLRWFSVIASLLSYPLVWSIARQIGGRRTALVAGTLFFAAPIGLFYSTEGRMYSLVWLLTLAHGWLALRLRHGRRVSLLLTLWMLVGSAGLLTHYLYGLVWAACGGWLVAYPGRCRRSLIVVGVALTVLAAVPWYLYAALQAPSWRVTEGWTFMPSAHGRVRDLIDLPLSYLSAAGSWGGPGWSRRAALATAVVFAGVLAWTLRRRLFRPRVLLLWAWLLAALSGPVLSDTLRGTYTTAVPRYAIAGLPAAVLLASLGLSRARWPVALVLALMLAVPWAFGNRLIMQERAAWEPFREIAGQVDAGARSGDLVILHSIPSGVAGVARYVQSDTAILPWTGQLRQRRVPEDLAAHAAGYRRVVLIAVHEVGEPTPQEDWLRVHGRVESEVRMGLGRIVYFVPLDGDRFAPPVTSPIGSRADADHDAG